MILVVEDELQINRLLCDFLSEQGYQVCAEKVFEPFYRGESRSKNGSGLGLYVVKCLATAMGYEVEAKVAEEVFEVEMRM